MDESYQQEKCEDCLFIGKRIGHGVLLTWLARVMSIGCCFGREPLFLSPAIHPKASHLHR